MNKSSFRPGEIGQTVYCNATISNRNGCQFTAFCVQCIIQNCTAITRGCLNIKTPYHYGNSHYQGKTVSRPSYLCNGNPIPQKAAFIFRRGLDRCLPLSMLKDIQVLKLLNSMLIIRTSNCIYKNACIDSAISGINTFRPRQNGRHYPDDIFKCIFLNENVWIPIEISLTFVPKGSINNIPAFVQIMAGRRPGDKPLSEPMMVSSLTHICVTRPQWVNSLTACVPKSTKLLLSHVCVKTLLGTNTRSYTYSHLRVPIYPQ